jgi:hypothetical protein
VVRRPLAKFWGRRKLLALVGLGAGVAAQAGLGSERTAQATGPVVGTNAFGGSLDPAADGVQGYAVGANNAGTFGRNNDLNGVGVYGAGPSGTGVFGESATGFGVGARSASGTGVYAISLTGVAISGVSTSHVGVIGSGAFFGVLGGNSGANPGVVGTSPTGPGVVGTASATWAAGVYGENLTGGHGLRGVSSGASGVGLHVTGQSSARAAVFVGNVEVNGDFTVLGGHAKSGALRHPDGSYRRFHALETPESWLEDVGDGQLVSGRAVVRLDPDFATFVSTQAYQVFLTPKGDCNGLYVAGQTAASFEVRELRAGTSGVDFSFRVIARRKDLAARSRLERVDAAPAAPEIPEQWRNVKFDTVHGEQGGPTVRQSATPNAPQASSTPTPQSSPQAP